ncbi:hypothetical protein [Mixta calida]|uniref:hypothetical protein n=1 Tax=Mixta calida TaxID=665913 RepID=UPI001054BA88|nr:hypothetical protein [Pantoea sp.]QNU44679.1 hypothetical protein IDH70_06595 [Mixta calida]
MGRLAVLSARRRNPARQQVILQRGLESGESRVICGYYWESDIDAARVMAAAVVARLRAKTKFNQQMEKAKAEFKRLSVGRGSSAENVFEQEQIKY